MPASAPVIVSPRALQRRPVRRIEQVAMRRLGFHARGVVAFVVAAMLIGGGLAPNVTAQTPDRSDVVLVLDFSA